MKWNRWFWLALAVLPMLCGNTEAGEKPQTEATAAAGGHELFMREWLPKDTRSHGGDGLGPVFNDSSCVACHNQGGVGGGGPAGKNVAVISAALNVDIGDFVRQKPSVAGQLFRSLLGLGPKMVRKPLTDDDWKERRQALVKEVAKIHPGFRTAKSIVLHHFSTQSKFNDWKRSLVEDEQFGMQQPFLMHDVEVAMEMEIDSSDNVRSIAPQRMQRMQRANVEIARLQQQASMFQPSTQRGRFALSKSERNPTALFGAGLLDSIPDSVLEAQAKKRFKGFPKVSGRVARLPDGKIGRFGWKAQKATLRDFTVTACAVELGLHVPEHPQSGNPLDAKYEPKGFDLTKDECTQLVDYLKALPAPQPRTPANQSEREYLAGGQKLFAAVGCATCHTQDLGDVQNVYSDLLVHDLGPALGDTGSYGVFVPNSPGGDDGGAVPPIAQLKTGAHLGRHTNAINLGHSHAEESAEVVDDAEAKPSKKIIGATQLEWRTPPLWGVRDSAPYMHDGRAKTLEQAIAVHGGEAAQSAREYFMLTSAERLQVQTFLKSLSVENAVQVSMKK